MAKTRSKTETDKLRDYAKMLFTKDNMTQKEVSAKTGVTEKTVGKWVAEGEWAKLKRNFLLTRQELMADMMDELVELNNAIQTRPPGLRFADSKLADIRQKLVKGIKDLETKASLPSVIASCTGLLDFVRKVDLPKAQDLTRVIDAYIKSLL